MDGADLGRRTPEALAMQFAVAGQILAQVNHFMRNTGEECNGMAIAGFADADEGNTLFHAKIG